MHRHDRLAMLGACHGHVRYRRLDSLEAYRSATPEQLARLSPRFRGVIRRLVDRGQPDVLCALWPPREVTWLVARLTIDPYARLLSVTKCPRAGCSVEMLAVRYDVRDAEAERRAWRAVGETLGRVPGAR